MNRNLAKLFLVRGFFWLHFFSAVLVPFLTETGGLTLSQVFGLNAWFMLVCSLLEAPTGAAADRFGRKNTMALGGAVAFFAALLYVLRPGFWGFVAAETVFAFAYTLQSGADEAYLFDLVKAEGREGEAGKLLARLESFKLLAILFGGLFGSVIAAKWGISAPMKAYALAAAASGALALTLAEPPRAEHEHKPGLLVTIREGWAALKGHPVLLSLSLELAITNGLAWSIIWLYQPFLKSLGVPVAWFGTVHAASALAQAAVLSRVDGLQSLAGSRRRLLTFAGFGCAASFVALALAKTPLLAAIAIVLCFTFGLARLPIYSAEMNPMIPSARRATILSLASVLRTMVIVVVNPVVGWAADRSLKGAALGLAAALIVVLGASRTSTLKS